MKKALKEHWEYNFNGFNLIGKILLCPVLAPWGCLVSLLIILYYGFLRHLEAQ